MDQEYRHQGHLGGGGIWGLLGGVGLFWGCQGGIRGVGVLRVYWGAGRDSRYSEARRGIGASGALGAPRGVGAILGCQGASGSIGGVRGVLRVATGLGA